MPISYGLGNYGTQRDEIERLKKTAREYHAKYHAIVDEYPCGAQMTEYINPNATKAREGYEAAVKRLREIDPDFPKEKS